MSWTHAAPPDGPFGVQRGIAEKDLHKLIVWQWQESRAVLRYILQGRFVTPLAAAKVIHMLRRIVDPTSRVVIMVTTLSKIDITDGSVAVWRQPEVNFRSFTTVWVNRLDAGGEDGGALSQAGGLIINTELQKMAAGLSSYMREHYNILIYKEATVRRRGIRPANRDLLEFVLEIADTARELHRKYNFSPTPKGGGGTANPPRFTLLRELIGRSIASLLAWMDTRLDIPDSDSGSGVVNKK